MCPIPQLLLLLLLFAPQQAQPRKPIVYTTPPQTLGAVLKQANQPDYEVRGMATFTLTSTAADDSLTGTLVYSLQEPARQQLAQWLKRPLNQVPATLTRANVKAVFAKGSACPWLKLEMNPVVLEGTELQLQLKTTTLAVPESRDYLGQLLCNLARQVNTNRQRRGIIAALNRALQGEEVER